jgi:hypothetical protein
VIVWSPELQQKENQLNILQLRIPDSCGADRNILLTNACGEPIYYQITFFLSSNHNPKQYA